MARCHCSLMCSPQPLARVLRALPKLALIFLVVHVVVMVYSILNRSPQVSKNSPLEDTDKNLADESSRITGNLSNNNPIPDDKRGNKANREAAKRLKYRNISKDILIGRTAH